jgi:hypothetical protein
LIIWSGVRAVEVPEAYRNIIHAAWYKEQLEIDKSLLDYSVKADAVKDVFKCSL